MDRASALIYPGSKTLAGWWRQLQARQPHAIHVGYVFVHRVETSVQVQRSEPIDTFTALLLQAISLLHREMAPADLGNLQRRLQVPAPMLRQLLAGLAQRGLLECSPDARWQVSKRGAIALERGAYPLLKLERRVFAFAERLDGAGERKGPPSYLPLAECPGVPWVVEEAYRFDASRLGECVSQSPEWKRRSSFPEDVEPMPAASGLADWQQVVIDRSERVLLLLAEVGAAATREWIGFAAKSDGWQLQEQAPVLRASAGEDSAVSNLVEAPTQNALADGWRAWCRERNLPANEVELCALTYQPPRLELRAPERLVQRLRAAKSDLLRNEAWILIGDGFLRTAVLLAIV